MAGLIVGVLAFAEAYAALAPFAWSGELGAVTFADLFGVPFWALAGVVVVVALVTFWLVARVEPRQGEGRES